jgi:hypothetical protein
MEEKFPLSAGPGNKNGFFPSEGPGYGPVFDKGEEFPFEGLFLTLRVCEGRVEGSVLLAGKKKSQGTNFGAI